MRFFIFISILLLSPFQVHALEQEPPAQPRGVIRHTDAKDFFWFVQPTTGERAFIGSVKDAELVIARFTKKIAPKVLASIRPAFVAGSPLTDRDQDGIPDTTEKILKTHPLKKDTDRDGYSDRLELEAGYSPLRGKKAKDFRKPAENILRGALVTDGASSWYIDTNGQRHHLATPTESFRVLFIISKIASDQELQRIPISIHSPTWLVVPQGYRADIAANKFKFARTLAWDPSGALVIADMTASGRILTLADTNNDGVLDKKTEIISGKKFPHGIAFADGKLFLAEETALTAWNYDDATHTITGEAIHIATLPPGTGVFAGGGHRTRTLAVGQDGKLYVAIGSACDTCDSSPEYARIVRMDLDGSNQETFADGLRNTVFFLQDEKGTWWGNDMGQDNLGDDLPPDELNIIQEGAQYGWPKCYAARIPIETAHAPHCAPSYAPEYGYQAHSAPLGLRFAPQSFGNNFAGNLFVALHGSTVRSTRIGYKIIGVTMDSHGKPLAERDVITGFLRGHAIVGRPVDMQFNQNGTLYISDDRANVIHRVRKVK